MSDLCLHKGSHVVSRGELLEVPAPPATATWFPICHGDVLVTVEQLLFNAGFTVEREQLSLGQKNNRFFGILDLKSPVAPGVTLAVGVRNSIDKTFPLGFCAGSRVFVCDNLAFRSELLVVRKHTVNGGKRFHEAIAQGIQRLPQFVETEAATIDTMRHAPIHPEMADSLILRSYEQGIISHRYLAEVLKAWRFRSPDFEEETLWSLFNAFTLALKPKAQSNPQEFSLQTIRLHALLTAN
jgi:hypothetical protein